MSRTSSDARWSKYHTSARVVVGAGLLILPLSACQSTMSVEEAKKVTASFGGSAFVPPPRTIEDITAILDQQKLADPGSAAAARARADQPPPDATDPTTLRKFYYERGQAAHDIGRAKQAIDDLTKALSYSDGFGSVPDFRILNALSWAEARGGNLSRAHAYRRRAIDAAPDRELGFRLNSLSVLAVDYASFGDLRTAEEALRSATTTYYDAMRRAPPRPDWVAGWNASLAQAEAALFRTRGRYDDAVAAWRRAIAALASSEGLARSTWIDELQAFLAYTLMLQDRPQEAEVEARRAVLGALANRGRYSLHTAHVLRSLVEAVGAQGRYVEAETLARAVLEICEKTGASQESVIVAGSRSALVAALAFQGRYREALAEYEKNRAALAANPEDTRRFISANTGYALPLIHTGQPDEALKILKTALDQSTSLLGERHPRVALIRGQMGLAYLRKDDHRRALSEFRAAASLVSVFSSDAEDGGSQRTSNLHRIREVLEGYLQLLSDIRGTPLEREARIDAAAEGFRVAGVLQASSVDRALNASAIRAAAHSPILSDLVRSEQDATMQPAALRGLLGNVLASGEQNSERIEADLRSRIAALDNARRALAQQIQKDFPRYATLVAPSAPSIESVREVLRDGEALISLVLLPTRTLVWAVAKTGDLEFGTSPLGRRELRGLVDKLRAALDPGARTVGDIPEFDVVTSHVLFRAVLEPVRGAWEHARTLLVVPYGSLGQIPFSLLVTKQIPSEPERGALFSNYGRIPWLIRTHAVVSVPSTAALVTLRTLPPPDLNRRPFIGFGDPYFSEQQAREAARERAPVDVALLTGRNLPITLRDLKIQSLPSRKLAILPRLPDTADEIRSIASAVNADPARDVFLGERANEQQVKTLDLSTYRVIAFATHGLVPGDLDGLTQPALALSAPEVAKVAGDGLLMMEEILALRLNADWVVLSACNTASGSGAGSEAISGLGRAFFYAGARALLVSYWPVETTSARALTTDVFKRQRADSGLSRAMALQQTMNALIDGPGYVDPKTNHVVFSYAHPIFWAPFALVGDGG